MKEKYFETENSEYDRREYSRSIHGRLTPRRFSIINEYVNRWNEVNYRSGHCGHEHDCCGCLCGVSMCFEIKSSGRYFYVELKKVYNYNY